MNSASEQDEKTLTKYCLTSELHQLKNKIDSLKILHLNISSLQYHFVELHLLPLKFILKFTLKLPLKFNLISLAIQS